VKDDYVAFLGRMAPCKGAHLAIEAARLAGVRLKLAGEIQPVFHDYWEHQVRPGIDGGQIEYVGEADRVMKNELLSRARALLFPIQWDEPFGLVMIEAMACGTPVLAFAGGSVDEVVSDGVNGWICGDVADMAGHVASLDIPPLACRKFVAERFSVARMADQYLEVYERALMGAAAAPAAELEA
jgi:glycosyltransferase involved in cell wall biosynthesis